MGIFSRITDIVNSNVNAMLDKAEDPEKMVKLMIHEMEDTLTEVKSAAAEVVAERIRVNRQLSAERMRTADWTSKAELAVNKGRDDLAREAMEQRIECDKRIMGYEKRLAEVEGLVKQYHGDIARLEDKLKSAYTRQRTLISNHQSAMTRKKVEEKIYRLNTSGAFAKFENYEQRIDRFQADVEIFQNSNANLEKEFQSLTRSQEVEDALSQLKAKLNAGPSQTPVEPGKKTKLKDKELNREAAEVVS